MPRRSRRLLLVALVLAALATGCGAPRQVPQEAAVPGAVRVTSFDFTESRILGELYAQALEANGVPVERVLSLGSRELVAPAMEQDVVDFVPEYSGSVLRFLGVDDATGGTEGEELALLEETLAGHGFALLYPAAAQNRNTVVVSRRTADEHGLRWVSDLAPYAADWTIGGPVECRERSTCLPGLRDRYRLLFESFVPFPATRYVAAALAEGEIDVGVMFTTDPELAGPDLVALADDRGLQPEEHVVPVVRQEVLDRLGDRLADPVAAVSRALDTAALGRMNRAAELEGQEPERVAARWLRSRGILT